MKKLIQILPLMLSLTLALCWSAPTFAQESSIACEVAPPTGLAVTNLAPTSATFSWSGVADQFQVQYSLASESWADGDEVITSSNSIDVTNLVVGFTYRVRVRAICNIGGSSTYSDIVTFLTENPCDIVSSISIINITSVGATITWPQVPGNLGYDIQFGQIGVPFNGNFTHIAEDVTSFTIAGLAPETLIRVRVRSVCSFGVTTWTDLNYFTTLEVCEVTTGIATSNITGNSATVTWDQMPANVGYEMQYTTVGDDLWANSTIVALGTDINTAEITGLARGERYRVRVRTLCADFPVTVGSIARFVTSSDCDTPPAVSADAITDTSATINWDNVGDNVGYEIQYRIGGLQNWAAGITATTAAGVNTLDITNLVPNTPYYYRVRGLCLYGKTVPNNNNRFVTAVSLLRKKGANSNMFEGMALYPNPSNGNVSVDLFASPKTMTTATVYSSTGQVVLQKEQISGVDGKVSYALNLSGVNAGIYFVRVSADNQIQTQKLVIK